MSTQLFSTNDDAVNLINPIHEHARKRPGEVAIITPHLCLTWEKLDRLVWSAALQLYRKGLRSGDRVGISMANPVIHLVANLALARLGIAHLAVPCTDVYRIGAAVKAALDLKVYVFDCEKDHKTIEGSIWLHEIDTTDLSQAQKEEIQATDPDLTWLILKSSGTTGAPKYAELSHRKAWQRMNRLATLFEYRHDDVFWGAPRLDFIVTKLRTLYALQSGAAVCFPIGLSISESLVDFLNKAKVTLACGTLSHLYQLVEVNKPLSGLRLFEAGSSFITEKIRNAFKEIVSPNLYVLYGTNEAEGLTVASPDQQKKLPNSVGWPIGGVQIEIVDHESKRLPPGVTGEVRTRGPGIIDRYLKNPEANSNAFKDGWFYPGDCAYWTNEGALILQGRKDDMMIFDGMNIYPAEIETVLVSHPNVKEAAAFSIKHEQFQDIPVAAVTLAASISETALIEFTKKILGNKHPKHILIVDDFPRNSMGKILKRELNRLFRNLEKS